MSAGLLGMGAEVPAESAPDYGLCPACGFLMYPVLEYLPCGHEGPPTLAPLEAAGIVYSWTRSWTGIDRATVIAMADFLDGALRISAPMFGSGEIAIGDLVTAVVGVHPPIALRRME
jgi:hypothetical protein